MRTLLHDPTANTIVIAAAALVPLMAMVGGGVDASRYYMAASRLQAACDAGALAARRAMTTDVFSSTHNQIALSFFDNNFTDGLYGSTSRTRAYTANASGVVTGTASAVMPSTIMRAFGYTNFNIAVSCSADINISNTDIMFVLDTTGSMGTTDAGGGMSRIQALRNAVMNFYDTVRSATAGTAQVRFGAVPYAMNVNVGGVIPTQHIANTHEYQSREPLFRSEDFISEGLEWIPRLTSNFGSSNWDHYRFLNRSGDPTRVNTADRDLCQLTLRGTYTVGDQRWEISGNTYILQAFSSGDSSRRAACRANVRRTRVTPIQVFDAYRYFQRTIDVSALKSGGSITLNTGVNGADQTHTWNGCIEEASTVNVANFNPVPANAFDLNINLIPATEAQRWKPSLPTAVWRRGQVAPLITTQENVTRPSGFCPAPAFRLTDITRTQLQSFVNGLQPQGNTYHDIGMIWGSRLISPNGLFAADNATAPNGDPISRHLVFMTDGILEPSLGIYGTYGIETLDFRITEDATSAAQRARHDARFQAVCRAAKAENISIWVVAFGTTLTQSLRDCSSPGRAYEAANSAQLEAAFQEIAQKIAALRLVQ